MDRKNLTGNKDKTKRVTGNDQEHEFATPALQEMADREAAKRAAAKKFKDLAEERAKRPKRESLMDRLEKFSEKHGVPLWILALIVFGVPLALFGWIMFGFAMGWWNQGWLGYLIHWIVGLIAIDLTIFMLFLCLMPQNIMTRILACLAVLIIGGGCIWVSAGSTILDIPYLFNPREDILTGITVREDGGLDTNQQYIDGVTSDGRKLSLMINKGTYDRFQNEDVGVSKVKVYYLPNTSMVMKLEY